MKRFKRILILLGVLAVGCIATLIVMNTEEKKEQIKNTDEVILEIDSASVTALSWEYDDTSLSFHKEENWTWDGDAAFPVDESKMDQLLGIFNSFGAAFIIENVEDYSQYGLDDPTCTIHVTTTDATYEIKLGDYSTMDSERYVSIGNGNVYLVKKDPFDTYEIELSDTILHDEIPSMDIVTEIAFSGIVNDTIVRDEESTVSYCADDIYFTTQNGETVPLDTANVESYISSIEKLSLTDYVSYNVTDEELASFGLSDPELTVTLTYTVSDDEGEEMSETFTLRIGLNAKEQAAKEAAEENGEEYTGTVTAYARVGDSQRVYQLTSANHTSVTAAAYNDLRHSDVFVISFEDINRIDISLEGAVHVINKETADDDEIYTYNDGEVSVQTLNTKLVALTVTEFCQDAPSDKQEISFTFALADENHPEMTMEIYRCDATSCLVVVNGQTLGLVSRSSVVNLIEAVNGIILG